MEDGFPQPVTNLLKAWAAGNKQALADLVPMVYDELRRLAQRRISSEKPGLSLQPTALVNELYLRLVGSTGLSFSDRRQFFALAAQMMRRILVDAARARGTAKRGGAAEKMSFEEAYFAAPGRQREIMALDDALEVLAKVDPQKARAVELRFFGGLGIEETAEVMGITVHAVRRDWTMAQAWLAREIGQAEHDPES